MYDETTGFITIYHQLDQRFAYKMEIIENTGKVFFLCVDYEYVLKNVPLTLEVQFIGLLLEFTNPGNYNNNPMNCTSKVRGTFFRTYS